MFLSLAKSFPWLFGEGRIKEAAARHMRGVLDSTSPEQARSLYAQAKSSTSMQTHANCTIPAFLPCSIKQRLYGAAGASGQARGTKGEAQGRGGAAQGRGGAGLAAGRVGGRARRAVGGCRGKLVAPGLPVCRKGIEESLPGALGGSQSSDPISAFTSPDTMLTTMEARNALPKPAMCRATPNSPSATHAARYSISVFTTK